MLHRMRVLLDELTGTGGEVVDDAALERLYAAPDDWLRVNFVATVDGAATGPDGRSGSINNAVDHRVFRLLRRLADAVVVGAGTVRGEGYGAVPGKPLVVVSRRGAVPPTLRSAEPGAVLLVTTARAEGAAEARELLGADQVLALGDDEVDVTRLRPALAERGLRRLLSEGGPQLFRSLLAAGQVDELDLTWVPRLIGGDPHRILAGDGNDVPLAPKVLLEEDGTLLGRWYVVR